MKYAFLTLAAVLVLTGAGCFSRDDGALPRADGSSSYDTNGAQSDETKELQALILVNTNLLLEAGRAGIDAPRTRDWSEQAARIVQQTALGDWDGAIADLKVLNAEIEAAIEAS